MIAVLIQLGIRGGTLLLALVGGILIPLLIWVVIGVGFRQLLAEWRDIRRGLLAGNLACSINVDCPPGYECAGGRCVPVSVT